MKRRTKKIISWSAAALLLVVGSAALYIYKEYNRKHKDTANVHAAYSLAATQLINEFENVTEKASRKFNDKVVEITGVVKEVVNDEQGHFTLVMGDTSSLSSVRCSMDSLHNDQLAGIRKGMEVCVKGVCSGFNPDELLGSDVILVRSVINHTNKTTKK